MKIEPRDIDRFCAKPDAKIAAILVFGPDSGLVRERATQICKTVVADLSDPFNVADLNSDIIAADPARLSDELHARSLMGGRRLVRVRDGGDSLSKPLQAMLALSQLEALLVIEAGDLGKSSSLRKLCEDSANAAAVICYVEDARDLARTIRDHLNQHGLDPTQDAVNYLAASLAGDRAIARRELEKLVIYMQGQQGGAQRRRVELDDAAACVGDGADLSVDDAIYAAFDRDILTCDRVMRKLLGEGTAPIVILRAAQRHATRLAYARSCMDSQGLSADAALAKMQPPIFWKLKTRTVEQLKRWQTGALFNALMHLNDVEAASKRTGTPAELLTLHALSNLGSNLKSDLGKTSR